MSKSRRPYLIRAIYDWSCDNGYTPHLLVAADQPGVIVPREYVHEGRITLNISPMAIQNLDLHSEPIWFSARFSGRSFDVHIPSGAVLAVFARENGEGAMFGEPEAATPAVENAGKPEPEPPQPPKPGRANLRVIK